MDTLSIHLTVKDEMFPRTYIVSDGAFAEMKDAVKAAGATYDGNMKSWKLPGPTAWDVLKTLRSQYTVAETALIRIDMDNGVVHKPENTDYRHSPVSTELWLRAKSSEFTWRRLPPVAVTIEITPEMAAAAVETFHVRHYAENRIHEQNINLHCVNKALERMADAANARFVELLKGKARTKENYTAALQALLGELEAA